METFSLLRTTIKGAAPCPRTHCITLEIKKKRTPFSSVIFVLGGWCRGGCNEVLIDNYFMDAYFLRVEMEETAFFQGVQSLVLEWNPLELEGSPPSGRVGYSASFSEDDIVIFGGGKLWSNGTVTNDLFIINTSLWKWESLQPDGTPPIPRQVHKLMLLCYYSRPV